MVSVVPRERRDVTRLDELQLHSVKKLKLFKSNTIYLLSSGVVVALVLFIIAITPGNGH